MSSETRTLRPFSGLAPFEDALSRPLLHFGEDICTPGSSIAVAIDRHTFQLRRVVIEWAPEEAFDDFQKDLLQGADNLGIPRSDLVLLVFAKTGYLKQVDLLKTVPLSDLESLERYIDLSSPRPKSLMAPQSGFVVEALVVLGRTLEPAPLKPWRKGTWLARSTFGVDTSLGKNLYRPLPLTEQVRDELGLPAKTVRYVYLGDHDPLGPFAGQPEQPILYIDEDVLAEIQTSVSSPVSKAMQYDMALDFLTAVLYESSRNPDLREMAVADLEGSLLGEIIRRIAGPSESEQAKLLGLIRSDPHKAVAHAEAAIDMAKPLIESLKGPDS